MPEKVKGRSAAGAGEVILDFSAVKPFEPLDSTKFYLCSVTNAPRQKKPAGPASAVELTIVAPDEVPVEEWIKDDSADGGWVKGEGIVLDKNGDAVMTRAKGRKLFRNYSLTPQSLPFLYEFIKGCDPKAELGESFKYNEKNYIGLQCATKITNEAYDEQVRPRVKKVYPASAYKKA